MADHSPAPHRPELDGLRGLAAYIVVLSHVSNTSGLWNKLFGLGGGQIGVMLFFVLSGYLMGTLYLDRPFKIAEVWIYGIHRAARVLPLFYVVVTLAIVLSLLSANIGIDLTVYPIGAGNAFYHYALIAGESVFWTIPVEIHFYIVFVFLWWLYARSVVALVTLIGAATIAFFLVQIDARFYQFLFFTGAFFLAGVLLSRASELLARLSAARLISAGMAIFFLLAILLFPNVYFALFKEHRWLVQMNALQMWHDPIYIVVIAGCLVAALASPIAKKALSSRFMIYSGKISYSIYLLHLPVIVWLDRFTPARNTPEVFLVLTFAITIVVASLSYRFIEQPARQWINETFAGQERASSADTAESPRLELRQS